MIAIHVIGCCGFVGGCFWVIAIIHVIGYIVGEWVGVPLVVVVG
jgi:hypothetical protein